MTTSDQKAIEAARECAALYWTRADHLREGLSADLLKHLSLPQLFAIVEAAELEANMCWAELMESDALMNAITAYRTAQKETHQTKGESE